MKVLKKALVGLVILVALLLVIGFFLPSRYTVERSIVIGAPVETVFGQVNDLAKNRNWSPWEEDDPTAKFVYGPVTVGVGAFYTWEGEKVGKGKLTITRVEANRRIDNALEFEGDETGESWWEFQRTPEGVETTWGVTGDLSDTPLGGYLVLIARPIIQANLEKGLENLKRVAEAAPPPPPPPPPAAEPTTDEAGERPDEGAGDTAAEEGG